MPTYVILYWSDLDFNGNPRHSWDVYSWTKNAKAANALLRECLKKHAQAFIAKRFE